MKKSLVKGYNLVEVNGKIRRARNYVSTSNNGCLSIPGGLKQQWGQIERVECLDQYVSFPVTFSGTPLSVQVSSGSLLEINADGFRIDHGTFGTPVVWSAVGP